LKEIPIKGNEEINFEQFKKILLGQKWNIFIDNMNNIIIYWYSFNEYYMFFIRVFLIYVV
jgi:hypothetical protein